MKMTKLMVAALLALPMMAMAMAPDSGPEPSDPPVQVDVDAKPVAGAKSVSGARSSSRSSSRSNSSSVSGSRSGSHSTSRSGDSAATSNNQVGVEDGDQTQGVEISEDNDFNYEEVVPAQLLPMILESGCRTGVNAGGGGRSGSGAAGVSWMTDRCWAMQSVINFIAMGEYETACWLLVDINRDQFKRLKRTPNCIAIAARLIAADKERADSSKAHKVDTSAFITRDEYKADTAERDKRVLERLVQK